MVPDGVYWYLVVGVVDSRYYIDLLAVHYIALHFLAHELVKMTVRCGICHINTKPYVPCNRSFHIRTPKEKQWLQIRLFKDTSTCIHHPLNLMLFVFKMLLEYYFKLCFFIHKTFEIRW
jgi:hypothetical protein